MTDTQITPTTQLVDANGLPSEQFYRFLQELAERPVSLENGGTGTELEDPGADRLLGWDDSDGDMGFITIGGGLSLSGSVLTALGLPLLHAREEQVSGTAGGTFTAGAWQTRTLNTVVSNAIAGATLSGNRITLPAGDYVIQASAPAHGGGQQKAKLYNITTTADVIMGTNGSTSGAAAVMSHSFVNGKFTLAAETVLELQHRTTTTVATSGFGLAASLGTEVYSEVLVWKLP